MEDKFGWDEQIYSVVMNICIALTNYHILKYPLRNEDGVYYKAVLEKYAHDALDKKRKQTEKSKKYRESKKNKKFW